MLPGETTIVSRRSIGDRKIWTKPLAFAADAGFAMGFQSIFALKPLLDRLLAGYFPLPTKCGKNGEPQGHPRTVKDGMSPRAERPADNSVGDVPEEPIEDYPEDQQRRETAQLTSAYPIQNSCAFITVHFPSVYTVGGRLALHRHDTQIAP